MQDIFVGRQPIYNSNLGIYAYEMLFRTGTENSAGENLNQDSATSQVVINTFLDMGLDNLVGKSLACINLTERFLLSDSSLPLPAERTRRFDHNLVQPVLRSASTARAPAELPEEQHP